LPSSNHMPTLRKLPVHMLKRGDMVWSSEHEWFYACSSDAVAPKEIPRRATQEVEVADPADVALAVAWNELSRNEKLGAQS